MTRIENHEKAMHDVQVENYEKAVARAVTPEQRAYRDKMLRHARAHREGMRALERGECARCAYVRAYLAEFPGGFEVLANKAFRHSCRGFGRAPS